MSRIAILALAALAACSPAPQNVAATRAAPLTSILPAVKTFAAVPVRTVSRSNTEIAQDILDLSFRMESGVPIPFLTRFDGPINVSVQGDLSDTLVTDLDQLLSRLRREANINIDLTNSTTPQIIVEAVPRRILNAAVPRAACFTVPRVSSWAEFLRMRRSETVDWTKLTKRDRAIMFVPSDVAPQEIRDCLHEELAQALGPLNDLYRLPDSVFNDDNIHNVLTSFDMLVLKAYYSPELANGMTRSQVAEKLPSLLSRLNPSGNRVANAPENDTNRDWIDAVQTALSGSATPSRRRAAARQAIQIGNAFGWGGTREAFAYYAHGRLQVGNDQRRALADFDAADRIYRANPATQIHAAHIAVQRAAFALTAGDADGVIALANGAIPLARDHQNAALLATLMMFKAEALSLQGNDAEAEAVRLDSLGWARYGFGEDRFVQARLNEIRALRPF
ncbi:hypothetical protein FHS72_001634 [Loktanella ponticola]|uniref:DUF2927 domain-containing protein n=1 Tax=Yoonia ponticola TaxID=1524255 RepID=A0A7W9BK88_9RHOB|nr:DUF2927 domain-containing protein [Yoonia ponticola]MBB5722010.1 hypothetical protein [Yoonia ponticola]